MPLINTGLLHGALRMEAKGLCAPEFEAVKSAFEAIFNDPQERGAGLCINVGGTTVVDLGMLRSTCCAAAASRNLHGTQRYLLKTT